MSMTYDLLDPFQNNSIFGVPVTHFTSKTRARWVPIDDLIIDFLCTRNIQHISTASMDVDIFMEAFGMSRYEGRWNMYHEYLPKILRKKVVDKLRKMLPKAQERYRSTAPYPPSPGITTTIPLTPLSPPSKGHSGTLLLLPAPELQSPPTTPNHNITSPSTRLPPPSGDDSGILLSLPAAILQSLSPTSHHSSNLLVPDSLQQLPTALTAHEEEPTEISAPTVQSSTVDFNSETSSINARAEVEALVDGTNEADSAITRELEELRAEKTRLQTQLEAQAYEIDQLKVYTTTLLEEQRWPSRVVADDRDCARRDSVSGSGLGSGSSTPPQISLLDLTDFEQETFDNKSAFPASSTNTSRPSSRRSQSSTAISPLKITSSILSPTACPLTPAAPTAFMYRSSISQSPSTMSSTPLPSVFSKMSLSTSSTPSSIGSPPQKIDTWEILLPDVGMGITPGHISDSARKGFEDFCRADAKIKKYTKIMQNGKKVVEQQQARKAEEWEVNETMLSYMEKIAAKHAAEWEGVQERPCRRE